MYEGSQARNTVGAQIPPNKDDLNPKHSSSLHHNGFLESDSIRHLNDKKSSIIRNLKNLNNKGDNFSVGTNTFANKSLTPMNEATAFHCRHLRCNGVIIVFFPKVYHKATFLNQPSKMNFQSLFLPTRHFSFLKL